MWTIWTVIGIVAISLIGTLAHFLYDISGHNKILGLFTAVNESTWEHIKIAITPTLIWSAVDGYLYGSNPNYYFAKIFSLISLVIIIPAIFYSYKIIFKKPILAIDILTFYLAITASQLLFYYLLGLDPVPYIVDYLCCGATFVFFGAYLLLTLLPLKSLIFRDPITNRYGFRGHSDKFNPFKKKHHKKSK